MKNISVRKRGPQRNPRAKKEVSQNFLGHVEKTDGCWLWTGCRDKDGYGHFAMNGATVKAHRASYILANGPITEGLHILHSCDNPSCVRPDHLYAGTRSQNMQDMVNRNRRMDLGGESNGNARLSNRDAEEVRKIYATGNFTQQMLAVKFNVSPATISNIVTNKRYKEAA